MPLCKNAMLYPDEYRAWHGMRSRCRDTANPRYGGRGLTVCERWRSFENFYADMGPKPEIGRSCQLDRIDNDGHYCPENCRWATIKQQARNRCSNRLIEYNGYIKTLSEWAESSGITTGCLYRRISYGWTLDRALSSPSWGPSHECCVGCQTTERKHWANGHCARCYHKFRSRRIHGWQREYAPRKSK